MHTSNAHDSSKFDMTSNVLMSKLVKQQIALFSLTACALRLIADARSNRQTLKIILPLNSIRVDFAKSLKHQCCKCVNLNLSVK